MENVEFRTKIKNGVIKVPKKYKDKFKDDAHVILLAEETGTKAGNIIDELMERPLKIKKFRPLTREQTHARR